MMEEYKEGQFRMDFENTGRANRKRRIFLDTETTGMCRSTDRIVEVCAIEVDDAFNEIDSFHAFINPQRKVPWFVTRIHGLNNKFLDDKPIFFDIGRDLLLFLEGSELWAHNMAFDAGMLNAEFTRNRLPTLEKVDCRLNCTLQLARSTFPGQKNSLDALLDRFSIDRSDRKLHGALIDTRLLVKVCQNLVSYKTQK